MTEAEAATQLVHATRANTVATMAAAIITASGRPFSIQQALDLSRDIHFAMHPIGGYGANMEWEKTKDQALAKVYGPTSN